MDERLWVGMNCLVVCLTTPSCYHPLIGEWDWRTWKHSRLFIFIFCRIFHLVKRFFCRWSLYCSDGRCCKAQGGWGSTEKSAQLKNLGALKHYKSHLMMKNLPTNFPCCLWIKRLCCASACFVFSLKYHFALYLLIASKPPWESIHSGKGAVDALHHWQPRTIVVTFMTQPVISSRLRRQSRDLDGGSLLFQHFTGICGLYWDWG